MLSQLARLLNNLIEKKNFNLKFKISISRKVYPLAVYSQIVLDERYWLHFKTFLIENVSLTRSFILNRESTWKVKSFKCPTNAEIKFKVPRIGWTICYWSEIDKLCNEKWMVWSFFSAMESNNCQVFNENFIFSSEQCRNNGWIGLRCSWAHCRLSKSTRSIWHIFLFIWFPIACG